MKFIYIVLVICLVSCTKEYIQHPTCRRFKEVRDFSAIDSIHDIEVDTLHPNNPLSQIACDSALIVMENESYWHGCITGGWERYRYLIQY